MARDLRLNNLFILISGKSRNEMKLKKPSAFYSCIIACLIFYTSCSSQNEYTSPKGYDLEHPVTINLESKLEEISGINYYAKDTSVFAISDATGSLYKIFPYKNAMVQKWKFGKNQDYEDLQLYNNIFYILSSSGNIVRVKFITPDSLQTSEYNFPEQKVEFETLYFDSSLNQLILICKDCKEDKKKEVSTFAFDIAMQKYTAGPYKIDADKIAALLHQDKIKFKPSAAAINPLTHELYILASVNKALVVADKNGNAKNVYLLNPSIYKQPEGITFTPKGDLLISNESAKQGAANILIIKYKRNHT
ncbi:MAG: SdiA-regulated domain-containing protein [Parafilimonas sp.]